VQEAIIKKYWGILFAVLCVMFLVGCAGRFAPADVEEIVLLSHYEDIEIRLQPGDADFERILGICRGDMYSEISGCPFGVSEIQFLAGEETVSIFPQATTAAVLQSEISAAKPKCWWLFRRKTCKS
jgi:hypothetical protein